jgi:acetyl esterase
MDRFIKESDKLELSQRLAARSLSLMPALHKITPKLFRPISLAMERLLGLRKIDLPKVVDYLVPVTSVQAQPTIQNTKIKIRVYYPNLESKKNTDTDIYEAEANNESSHQVRTLVYFHGGGCVIGSIETHDHFCRYLAKHSNMNIVSVDYRLAPEYKFPTPICDAIDAWNWINDHHKQLNLSPDHIGVGGDSAGGYLACLIGQIQLQESLPVRTQVLPSFQFLLYPMMNLQSTTESYKKFSNNLILTNKLMDYFIGHYLNSSDEAELPIVSPLKNKNLNNSVNTYILTLGYDPLRDDGIAYAERLKQSGAQVNHEHYPDCMHAFISVAAISRRAREASHSIAMALNKFNH